MSFGQTKMRKKVDELAPGVAVCDSKGRDWIVITVAPHQFYCGIEGPNGPVSETRHDCLAKVPEEFKPWAKRLLRNFNNLSAQKEAQNAATV